MTCCLNYYENKLIAVFILRLKLLHYRTVVQRRLFGTALAPPNLGATFPSASGEPGLHTVLRETRANKCQLTFYLYLIRNKQTGWVKYTISCSHFTVRLYLTISCTPIFLYLYSATFCRCKVVCDPVHLASFKLFQ